jgi:polar amino acid transport system substrate-binding protein
MYITKRLSALPLIAILAAACTGATASPSTSPASAAPSLAPSVAPSAAESLAPSASADACAPDALTLVTDGKLTVGTDNPAYPPYFGGEPPADGSWEISDPNSGEGFESAVAYAVADELGFEKADVAWVVVPFANSYAPGPKAFDFDVNQVSYTADRAQAVDLSDGYYFGNQSLVTLKGNKFESAKTIGELKDARLGAQVGTTSYDFITGTIQPTTEASIYDTNDAAIEALKAEQIDGVIVDLPTAQFITNVQIENGVLVGQFETGSGEQEHFSLVLAKDSPLTDCVNQAIAALTADGTLDRLVEQWLPDKDVPTIAP